MADEHKLTPNADEAILLAHKEEIKAGLNSLLEQIHLLLKKIG